MHRKYELCLRLSSEEQAQLECDARRCGLSKTAYLRRLILGAEIKARPTQEIKDLRTEIHHIGNNINQIARSVNAGIARPEDAKQGLYLLRQVYATSSTERKQMTRSLQPTRTATPVWSTGRCWRPNER